MKSKLIISIASLVSVLVGLTACDQQKQESEHKHNYVSSGVWSKNSSEHWVLATCSECGQKLYANRGEHIDSDGNHLCDKCGYVMGEDGHIHTFANTWSTNSTQHWHASTCGHNVTSALANHVDSDSNGYCDVCNFKMSNPDPDPDVETYYAGIDANSSTLLSDLRALNSKKHTKKYSYDTLKPIFRYIDEDPDGSGKILGFYDNKLVGPAWDSAKTWNREHTWPKSIGGDRVQGDAHVIRPAWVDSNSDRGNKYYSYNQYDPACLGHEDYRGICARIMFYCVVADGNLSLIDKESGGNDQMGKLSNLLEWNLKYLPTTSSSASPELRLEQNRNNLIQEKYQGNRNPFVDHPEYACKIWGTTNSETRRICGM